VGRNLNAWFYKPRKVVAVTIHSWDLAVDNDGASEQRLLETGRDMLRIASPGTGSHPSAKKSSAALWEKGWRERVGVSGGIVGKAGRSAV